MNIFKKIIKILFILTMVFVLLAGILSVFLRTRPVEKIPIIGGYKPLNVLGGSMEPAIKIGSVVLVRKVEPQKIKVGDIITFKPPISPGNPQQSSSMITHRVIKLFKDKRSFETKGDANKTSDGNRVKGSQIIGKVVFSIPYLGELSLFTKSRNGYLLMILLPGLAIILFETKNIISQIKAIRKESSA